MKLPMSCLNHLSPIQCLLKKSDLHFLISFVTRTKPIERTSKIIVDWRTNSNIKENLAEWWKEECFVFYSQFNFLAATKNLYIDIAFAFQIFEASQLALENSIFREDTSNWFSFIHLSIIKRITTLTFNFQKYCLVGFEYKPFEATENEISHMKMTFFFWKWNQSYENDILLNIILPSLHQSWNFLAFLFLQYPTPTLKLLPIAISFCRRTKSDAQPVCSYPGNKIST